MTTSVFHRKSTLPGSFYAYNAILIVKGEEMGKVEVIAGSMFSGKTEELIRRLTRAEIAKQKVVVFKPSIDVRYSELHIVSHDVSKR